MHYPLTKAAIAAFLLSVLATPLLYPANAAVLNDTTAAAEAPDAAVPGHAHRSLPPRSKDPISGTTADKTPDSLNPGTHTSASGMGASDNTMSSSTGSEAVSGH